MNHARSSTRTPSRRRTPVALAAVTVAAIVPASADAQSSYDPAALTAGGAGASAAASVRGIECRSGCTSLRTAGIGATVRVRGRAMRDVRRVVLLGGSGASDDVVVPATRVSGTKLDVRVPSRARTGPVAVLNADGAASAPSSAILAISEASRSSGVEAEVVRRRVVLGGAAQRLRVMVHGTRPTDVTVRLGLRGGAAPTRVWTLRDVHPGVPREVRWIPRLRGDATMRAGRYAFAVATGSGEVVARSARASAATSFRFLPAIFPVRAAHTYGDGLGAGRGHQGHDVFARCGAPLVAAMSATVQKVATQSRAGHYVVLDLDGDDRDIAYMHLRERALVREGQHVDAGQLVGYVGDTGRASGCHLHFELWSAPGWYEGGRPLDGGPLLRSWDRVS